MKKLLKRLNIMLRKPAIKVHSGKITDNEVNYVIERDGVNETLFYRGNNVKLSNDVSISLLMVLLQAMKRKRTIKLNEAISKQCHTNLDKFMSIYAGWFDAYDKVTIQSPIMENIAAAKTKRVGCFFTGGVDSFYTLLNRKDEITDLIYVHGFDLGLEETQLRQQVHQLGKRVAADFGMNFIEIETNAREILKNWGRWGTHAHGLALVSVAKLLSKEIDKVYIPSSTSTDNLFPWGTHPETDALLGDDTIQVVHDTVDIKRTDKTVAVSQSEEALRSLRVCYKNTDDAYNCCECEKCLRTMTSLYAVNKLKEAITFHKPLNLELIKSLDLGWDVKNEMARDNLALMAENGLEDSEVYAAWQRN